MKPTRKQKIVIHKEGKELAMENAFDVVHLVNLDKHFKAIIIPMFKD